MENKQICPHCKSQEVVKRGFKQTEAHGLRQRYFCKSCSKRFIPQDAFFRMRNSPQKITCALDLFCRGLSTRGVQEHFKAFFPHNSDHSTILRWIRKYSLKIANFTDNQKAQTGNYMEIDEMEYNRRKSHKSKKGIDKNWFIDAIDVKTRFIVSSAYVKQRSKQELKKILLKVKENSENTKTIKTDAHAIYKNVVNKSFGFNNKSKKYEIDHQIRNAKAGEGFNIWIERLHNTFRQRTQNFRGFHGSIESAYALMKGLEIYYNFIRKHESLRGKSPSELAIPTLQFQTPNRWLELIKLSHHA